jgi:multicomponent Na+:H+ antiporter subunit D
MQTSSIIPFFVVIPLGAAFATSLLGRKIRSFVDAWAALVTFTLAALAIVSVRLLNLEGVIAYSVGGWIPPVGIGLVLDSLSVFMLVVVNLVAFCVALFSANYMEKFTAKPKFYTLFFLMIAGMNGVIVAGDLFNLFVFLEIAAVASYALVAFGTERHELEAAFKYAVMGAIGSLFILLAIGFLYSYTSTLNMADMAQELAGRPSSNIILMVSVLFLMGFGLKAALVPFHAWLPDAHPSAPAPISAMLSGVLIKSLGIYALCRIFYNVIGISPAISSILMSLGVISMVVGAVLAIGQWDLKRLLAYSSISQIGYIFLSLGLGTPLGILAGLFHLFNHSIFKSLLFLNSGALEYATGTRDLKKMGAVAKSMPFTSTTGIIASMSIAGIPPFNGFWSKLLIIVAAVQAQRFGYAFWAVFVSVLTLAMYLKVLRYAFFAKEKNGAASVKEVPIFMKLSMGLLACMCVAGGILFISGINEVFLQRAAQVLFDGLKYASSVLGAVAR